MKRKWKWRYLLFFLIPFLLTQSVSPDLKSQQFLLGKEIKEVPEGTYILSNFKIEKRKEGQVKFTDGEQSFWAKVSPKLDLPSGTMQLTVLKTGHFVEVLKAESADYKEKKFSVYGIRNGKVIVNIEGQPQAFDHRLPCAEGTFLVNQNTNVTEVRCSSQSY